MGIFHIGAIPAGRTRRGRRLQLPSGRANATRQLTTAMPYSAAGGPARDDRHRAHIGRCPRLTPALPPAADARSPTLTAKSHRARPKNPARTEGAGLTIPIAAGDHRGSVQRALSARDHSDLDPRQASRADRTLSIGHQRETPVRDPHVQTMHYAVGAGEGISYRDPEALSFSNHLGGFELVDKELRIKPTEHFSDEREVRTAIEPFLRAWEIEADLTSNVGAIRFAFERVELIDRDPPPPGSPQVIASTGACSAFATVSAAAHLTCRTYPQPSQTFRATPEVHHAYRRWIGFRSGKEPLQSMAFFVLTLLESVAGGRKSAAHTFQIDFAVLATTGRLSSTKGDQSTARKAGRGVQFQELSETEKQWLEEAVRRVILQLGRHASGAPSAVLSMDDLPRM